MANHTELWHGVEIVSAHLSLDVIFLVVSSRLKLAEKWKVSCVHKPFFQELR